MKSCTENKLKRPTKKFVPSKTHAPPPYCSDKKSTRMDPICHPKSIINNRTLAKTYSDDDLVSMGALYLQDQASRQPKCVCISKRTPKACDCLQKFALLPYQYSLSCSKYMVMFAKKNKFDQQTTIIDWIKYAASEKSARRFHVPQLRSRVDVELTTEHGDGPMGPMILGPSDFHEDSDIITICIHQWSKVLYKNPRQITTMFIAMVHQEDGIAIMDVPTVWNGREKFTVTFSGPSR